MRRKIVGLVFGFGLDGELLRASASRFLERTGMPFLGEVVVVCSGGLADAIVNPAGVGFSLIEGGGQMGRGGGERMIVYLEVLVRDSPVQRSCFGAW